jgi:hypothetical protein
MPPVKYTGMFLVALLNLLFSAGCDKNPSYKIEVDAVHNPDIQGLGSYKIVASSAMISEKDLRYKEAEKYVKTALSGKGFYEAEDVESADMIVDIDYGISEPRIETKTISEPIVVNFGSGWKKITVMVNDGFGGQFPTTRTVYDPPQRETVGYNKRRIPIKTYTKHLVIKARARKSKDEKKAPELAWTVWVTSNDENGDLREYLPVMAAAAIRYVGTSTRETEEIKLKGRDEVVEFVKAGM